MGVCQNLHYMEFGSIYDSSFKVRHGINCTIQADDIRI